MNAISKRKDTTLITFLLLFALSAVLSVGVLSGCEGPSGSEGPQGPDGEQGPEGPVGPAGEDGSMMYSGQGAPGSDVGSEGDYYLDTNTGEMFGPKESTGWGNPIIVLMGEDGQDGADGEDGSQIHSGAGTPSSSLGLEGDFYLDKSSYELYGPKTSSGWGSPINLKGADGNANVTRYIHPGHDFTVDSDLNISMQVNNAEESAWIAYLKKTDPNGIDIYYHMPGWGYGGNSQYSVFHYFDLSFRIRLQSGSGEEYDQVKIVRIESFSTENHTKQKSGEAIIPTTLDITNYKEVADYYGFRSE